MSSDDESKTKRELLRDMKKLKDKLTKERKKSANLQKMLNKLTGNIYVHCLTLI